MTAKTKKALDAERKAIGARIRACFEKEQVHVRAGSWQGLDGGDVTFVGMPGQLHGTVCTCCPSSVNYVEPT